MRRFLSSHILPTALFRQRLKDDFDAQASFITYHTQSSPKAKFNVSQFSGCEACILNAEKGKVEAGHGIESIVEVLGFIIGLITNDTGELGHADMSIFGLELMYTALNGGQTGKWYQVWD